MNREIVFSLIYILSVFISSISQILLKQSATRTYSNKIREYLNIRVICAYSMFFSATLLTVIALKYVSLGQGTIYESFGYIFVTIFGVIFLHEKLNKRKVKGVILIILGVAIFSFMG